MCGSCDQRTECVVTLSFSSCLMIDDSFSFIYDSFSFIDENLLNRSSSARWLISIQNEELLRFALIKKYSMIELAITTALLEQERFGAKARARNWTKALKGCRPFLAAGVNHASYTLCFWLQHTVLLYTCYKLPSSPVFSPFCAVARSPLNPAALAFVPFGIVLVRVRVFFGL